MTKVDSHSSSRDVGLIYLLGDSHTRSFAYHSAFLPLFVGSGKELCFLTNEHARHTEATLVQNLKRIPSSAPIMFVLGEPDVRLFLEDYQNIRTQSDRSPEEHVKTCVTRYADTIRKIRTQFENRLLIYNSIPTQRLDHNLLARHYNDLLSKYCREERLTFVDTWEELVRPDGLVDPHFSAEHIHLNERITPIVVTQLINEHVLPSHTLHENAFRWSYAYEFPIGTTNRTRIWGDAALDPRSSKFVHSQIVCRTIQRIVDFLTRLPNPSVLVANSREGFIPFLLPKEIASNIVATDADTDKIRMAQMLQNYVDRSDIHFEHLPLNRSITNDWNRFDVVISDLVGLSNQETHTLLSQINPSDGRAAFLLVDESKITSVKRYLPGDNTIIERIDIGNDPEKQTSVVLICRFHNEFDRLMFHRCKVESTIKRYGTRLRSLGKKLLGRAA